jgi:hypothetical protein
MSLEKMRVHSAAELQTWLAGEAEVREELEALMGLELGVDEHSLDTLEAFLLRRYRTPDEALTLDQRGVLDAAARHVGLVMVLGIGGARWDVILDDPDHVYYRLPVVRLPDGSTDCPLTAVTAALDRRTGTYLRELVEGYAELYDNDADEE